MQAEHRSWSSGDGYRLAFNGMESDDEVSGSGNSQDFGARIYDSRLGRWMSTDPLFGKYPYLSPYIFAAGSPIIFIDADGREIINGHDKNDEQDKSNYIKVQRAMNIVKATLPDLYNEIHENKDIQVTIKIGNLADYSEKMEIGNTTSYGGGIETHELGKIETPLLGARQIVPQNNGSK
jgi:RHS repeat-associated protein